MTQVFDFCWTLADVARTKEFQARLDAEGEEHFCSDDFRRLGCDRFMEHPEREVGAYFAKLKYHKLAEPCGEVASKIESNNRRKVDLWQWTVRGRNVGKERLM